jgi:hypothetical protein
MYGKAVKGSGRALMCVTISVSVRQKSEKPRKMPEDLVFRPRIEPGIPQYKSETLPIEQTLCMPAYNISSEDQIMPA